MVSQGIHRRRGEKSLIAACEINHSVYSSLSKEAKLTNPLLLTEATSFDSCFFGLSPVRVCISVITASSPEEAKLQSSHSLKSFSVIAPDRVASGIPSPYSSNVGNPLTTTPCNSISTLRFLLFLPSTSYLITDSFSEYILAARERSCRSSLAHKQQGRYAIILSLSCPTQELTALFQIRLDEFTRPAPWSACIHQHGPAVGRPEE